MKNTESKIFFAPIVAILLALLPLMQYIFEERISSKNELVTIDGNLEMYPHLEATGGRYRTSFNYILSIEGYNNSFRVTNDCISCLNNISHFEKSNVFGPGRKNNVYLKISKSSFTELNNGKEIVIYGMSKDGQIYLDDSCTIIHHNKSKNGLYFSIFAISILVINLIIFRKKYF